MIESCKNYLITRFKEIRKEDGATAPYTDENIFIGNMPRDFLKDNDYAVNCFMLQDRKKRTAKIVKRERNQEKTHYDYTKKRFKRDVLFRCFLYAKAFDDLWGKPGFIGFVDQFEQKVADADRVIADSGNNAIRIDLHDAVKPWNTGVEKERVKLEPYKAIVRVSFEGGIYITYSVPIIPDVDFTANYS